MPSTPGCWIIQGFPWKFVVLLQPVHTSLPAVHTSVPRRPHLWLGVSLENLYKYMKMKRENTRMKCGRKCDAVHTWILGFHMLCCETEMWTVRIPFRELKFFNVINGGVDSEMCASALYWGPALLMGPASPFAHKGSGTSCSK